MHAAQYSSECRDKFDKYCFALIVVVIIQDRKFYTDLHSPLETGICEADFFIMDYPFCLNHSFVHQLLHDASCHHRLPASSRYDGCTCSVSAMHALHCFDLRFVLDS